MKIPSVLSALALLLSGCASSVTPATAGGNTVGEHGVMLVINIGGEMKKEGGNSAPNSSTNTPTADVKPTTTLEVPLNKNGL